MGIIFCTPSFAHLLPFSLFPIALGILLAYDGLDTHMVGWSLFLLVACEIFWGLDLGVLSLSYLGTAFVLRIAVQFMSITPVIREGGWAPISLIRGSVVGWLLALLMMACAAAVESGIYQRGSFLTLLSWTYYPLGVVLKGTLVGVILGILALRRIDIPFRREIHFGTSS